MKSNDGWQPYHFPCTFFFLLLPWIRSKSTVSPVLSHRVNPNSPLQSFRLNYRSSRSQNPPHPHTLSLPCRCDTFQRHFLITLQHWWGQRWKWCRGRGLLKECANSLEAIPQKMKQNASLSMSIPPIRAHRDTMQTAQASVIFASSSYLYYRKTLEDFFFFFFFTFHTVNQPKLSNGNSDSSQTHREGTSPLRELSQQG